MNTSLGQRIHQARLRKNISIAEISKSTRINERILKSMEADDYESLPNIVYLKAYIKMLSRLLDLDNKEMILLLESNFSEEVIPEPQEKADRMYAHFLFNAKSIIPLMINKKVVVASFSIVMFSIIFWYISAVFNQANIVLDLKKIVIKKDKVVQNTVAPAPVVPAAVPLAVELTAQKNKCWIAYKIDQEAVKTLTMKPGDHLKLSGTKIRIVFGNPKSMTVKKDGEVYNFEDDINEKGTAGLIFPETLKERYPRPFFVTSEDGVLQTSNEYLKNPKRDF